MSTKTLTRAEISETISDKAKISRQKANDLLESVLDEMIIGLKKEKMLKLSSFGSFSIRQKKDRIGRNPKTGKEVVIQPRKTVSFKSSHILKDWVATGKRPS